MSGEYRNNHYVPVWYQKRFVPNPDSDYELFYLNLNPPVFFDSKGKAHTGKAIRKLGFRHCFTEKDLYTINFQGVESKIIEQYFFGEIDKKRRLAVEQCANFSHPWNGSDFFKDLLLYTCQII